MHEIAYNRSCCKKMVFQYAAAVFLLYMLTTTMLSPLNLILFNHTCAPFNDIYFFTITSFGLESLSRVCIGHPWTSYGLLSLVRLRRMRRRWRKRRRGVSPSSVTRWSVSGRVARWWDRRTDEMTDCLCPGALTPALLSPQEMINARANFKHCELNSCF